MPTTAIITECSYVNSFPSQYGDADGKLHCYRYVFDDQVEGTANHKAAPSWSVGDEVDYEITGDHKGVNKLKVGGVGKLQGGARPPQRASAPPTRSGPPARQAPPPVRQNGSAGQGGAYVGEAVGHAISNAALDLRELSNNPDHDILADHDAVGKWVWQRASVYLRVSDALRAGKLSAAGADAAPNPQPAQPAPPPRQEPPPRRPAPTQSGAAFDDTGADQDVPF